MLRHEYAQLKTVEAQLRECLQEEQVQLAASASEAMKKVSQLMMLAGIGNLSAWTFVTELFGWRRFSNRRQVAGALGLAPTPHISGELAREQGISKAGNPRVRVMAIQIAWGWLRWQPRSALSLWFQQRFGTGKRAKRVGIVALARKLMVALWRYLEQGLVPTGARLKGDPPAGALPARP
jgi:transposase